MTEESLHIDFGSLARQDPDFAAVLDKGAGQIDFRVPESLRALTYSILRVHFDLEIQLPDDRLCPPVPVRYEYILWIQGLLDTTSDAFSDAFDPKRNVVGIDIGTGASCIYPLLGCSKRPLWRFGGTEIDETSFKSAIENVSRNKLQKRIRVALVDPAGPIIALKKLGIQKADFVMCNPPFYDSKQEMTKKEAAKKLAPSAVCSGAEVEMITEGGDLGFAMRLLAESLELKAQIQWYSIMLGKLESAQTLVTELKKQGITNWAVTCLKGGHVTRRWAIAWSFQNLRASKKIARGYENKPQMLPFSSQLEVSVPDDSPTRVKSHLKQIFGDMRLKCTWNSDADTVICFARENTWSRAARRKFARSGKPDTPIASDDEEDCALGVRIRVTDNPAQMSIRWLQGDDPTLFESFWGMVLREVKKVYIEEK